MPTSIARLLWVLLLAAFVLPIHAAEPPKVRLLRLPEGAHAQAAVDGVGRLHVIYAKGDPVNCDAYYIRSDDGGYSFSRPIRVNSVEGSVIVAGTVRGPQIAVGKENRVHVGWMGSGKAGRTAGRLAPMLYARLNDAGDGFEPQRDVSADHAGLDGGSSVTADAEGNVYLAWHAPKHADAEGEENRVVWVARSQDEGKSFAAAVAVNPPTGVCACCGIRAFADSAGQVFIAYRSAEKAVNRDMQVLMSSDRGQSFTTAASDPWNVSQCVMSTSAFAPAPGGGVIAAWETRKQIRISRLPAGKTALSPATDVSGPAANRKHPSLAVNVSGDLLVVWAEVAGWGKPGTVNWQRYDANGTAIGQPERAKDLPAWGTAAALVLKDGSFAIIY